ncbi:MAG TPA: NAD(P)-dependent oxidoreductase [Streptosporangiaceae bacterium]|jgi:3-hydroxyisobutyrate dehydrogenase|nr:NAD(P)-dependent oxidoreductase [Streptosporangiaceae bacterium]
MASDNRPVVALLGTGIMGAGMGRNIAKAGLPLRVWNRTKDKAEPLAGDGVVVAGTPADAVRDADVIVTMLPDAETVQGVMGQAEPGLRAGQVWAQTSTVGLEGAEKLAELAIRHELIFVDCPVLGTRKPAEDGALIVFAGGPDAARSQVEPVFDAIGSKTVWLGEAGTASRLKLVANSWVLAVTTATAEALALARGLDVDPNLFLEAISGGSLDSAYLRTKAAAILKDDFSPNFSVSLAAKDARLVVEAGQAHGLRLDVADGAARKLGRAAELGHADEDMAAAYFACFDSH